MIRRVFFVFVLVALSMHASAQAQTQAPPQSASTPDTTETNRGAIMPFLEGTDVFWTLWRFEDLRPTPGSSEEPTRFFPTKLEADIFPHLVVAQNFTDVVDIDRQAIRGEDKVKEFAYSISGTPAVRIRMLRDVSAPVRTPSFMPRVNVQFLWARNFKAALTEARKQTSKDPALADIGAAFARLPSVSLWEAHVIGGHHSNGQDGCITTEQERIPANTGDCLPAGVTPTQGNVNRRDGSFSTNYVRTGINYSRNWMNGSTDLQAVREARLRAEFEYHPRAWVDENIVDIYGRARLLLGGAYAVRNVRLCKKRLEGSAGIVWNPGVVGTVPEVSTTVQASCFPTVNGGWGFFARLYSGQDYYNVGFLDKVTRIHVGATFNQTDFFKFRRRSAVSTP